jgi:hypothetical protein
MTKRRLVLVAVLLLLGICVSVRSQLQGAGNDKKTPDVLQTVKAFLNFGLTGQAKAAADLGEPGKAYSREEKIKKDFGRLDAKKPPAIVSLHADDEAALAITEPVVTKEKKGKRQGGPLSIRLVKKNNRWLIRDVDMGKDQAGSNLKRFQGEHPKAKVVLPKEDK